MLAEGCSLQMKARRGWGLRLGNRVFLAGLEDVGEGSGKVRVGGRLVPNSRGCVANAHLDSFNSAHRRPHPGLLLELKSRFTPWGAGGFLMRRNARRKWNALALALSHQ